LKNIKPVVKYPYNYIVGCTGCEDKCPNGAICFPSIEIIGEVKKKYGITG